MEKVNFDDHAAEYEKTMAQDLGFFTEETGYLAEYKVKIVKETIGHSEPLNILEYGCGIGMNINFFTKHFPKANIFGCDISQKSLEVARERNKNVNFFLINPDNNKKFEGFFDLVFIACVFHHIHPKHRKESMENVFNLTKKGGKFYFFEHNPYNPVTRHIVNTCIWDTDAILLKPKESLNLISNAGFKIERKNKYTLFFPSYMRFLRFSEKLISFIPLGGQYYIKARKD